MSCKIIKSSGVRYVGGNLYVDFPNTVLNNCDIILATIVQDISYTNPMGTVFFVINGVKIEVYTKYHNYARIIQLKKCTPYTLGYGGEIPSLVVLNCLPKVTLPQPSAEPTVPAEE